MMGWLKKKTCPAPPPMPVGDPLAAIPLKPQNVEVRRDGKGRIHLRMTPALKPFHRKVAKWLRYDYCAKVELDEYGSQYYSLVDGQHTLRAIIDEMVVTLGKSRTDVAASVVEFTKSLMARNMIALQIPAENHLRG